MHEVSSASLAYEYNAIRKKQIRTLMDILAQYAGFRSTDNLENKLERVLRNTSGKDLDMWIAQISLNKSRTDLDSLVEDLTNHETYFFRDATQFSVLSEKLLPQHFSKANKGKFRIWSAASASGEEAYTLAILAAEYALANGLAYWAGGEVQFKPDFNIEVHGSDISRQAIRLAKDGVYTKFGLSSFRDMSERYWKYFKQQDSKVGQKSAQGCQYFSPIDSIKALVSFERHNLVEPLGNRFGKFDLIVCRNLFIYIDEEGQKKIQKNLEDALFTGGALIFSAVDRLHDKKSFKEHWKGNSLYFEKKS